MKNLGRVVGGFLGEWTQRLLPGLLVVVGPTWAGLAKGRSITWALVASGVGAVWTVVDRVRNERRAKLESSRIEAIRRELSPASPASVALLLDLQDELTLLSPTTRISLYAPIGPKPISCFALVGRRSDHTKFREPGVRVIYPANEGLVAKAWAEGTFFKDGLPADRTKWNQVMADSYGLSLESAKSLRMQSRSYACVRLTADGRGEPASLGVLVIESLHPAGITADKIDAIVASRLYSHIAHRSATLTWLRNQKDDQRLVSQHNEKWTGKR